MCDCFGFSVGECWSISRCEMYDECVELEAVMENMSGIVVILEEGEEDGR